MSQINKDKAKKPVVRTSDAGKRIKINVT